MGKKKEVIYGFLATGLINLFLVLTAIGEEIITSGFITAVCVLFALSIGIRVMLASAEKESDGQDAATDWSSWAWYTLGALMASAVSLWLVLS